MKFLVRPTGLEPARLCRQRILSSLRLPFRQERIILLVPATGLEPARPRTPEFEAGASSIPPDGHHYWCAERDLNPHDICHCPLKTACLPVPPPAHWSGKEDLNLRSTASEAVAFTRLSYFQTRTKTLLVGATRFELATSCSQNTRATRLRHAPTTPGGKRGIRTHSFLRKRIYSPPQPSNSAAFPQFQATWPRGVLILPPGFPCLTFKRYRPFIVIPKRNSMSGRGPAPELRETRAVPISVYARHSPILDIAGSADIPRFPTPGSLRPQRLFLC